MLYCISLLLLLRWDMVKVKGWSGGLVRVKGGLKCRGRVKSVITNVITGRFKK